MSSLSADFPTPFSKIAPAYVHPAHRITGDGLLPMTPTAMARAFPPTDSPQHRFPADSSRFPKTLPLSADWGGGEQLGGCSKIRGGGTRRPLIKQFADSRREL